jgi:rhodanese-related sulfurtransferase
MGEFIMNNLGLVALFVASGAMLAWPDLSRLAGASHELGTFDATRLINQGPHLVLDVSDSAEFATGHLPRARNIPVRELTGRLEEIGKFRDKPVIVTAGSSTRAAAASRLLKRSGFKNVYQLKGGIAAWKQASLPVEK